MLHRLLRGDSAGTYLWFDADVVEAGDLVVSGAFIQRTVEVAGVLVTVATDDRDLREQILASARPGDLCAPTAPTIPGGQTAMTREGRGELLSAKVCAYRRDGFSGDYQLSYAGVLINVVDAEAAFAAAEGSLRPHVDLRRRGFDSSSSSCEPPTTILAEATSSAQLCMRSGCEGSIKLGDGDVRRR